jgi:hypothetical protein
VGQGEGEGEGDFGVDAYRKYRETVLGMCPKLKILDGKKAGERVDPRASRRQRMPDGREVFLSNMPCVCVCVCVCTMRGSRAPRLSFFFLL